MATAFRAVLLLCCGPWVIEGAGVHAAQAREKTIEIALPAPDRPAPPPGRFDWMRFRGEYDFADCRHESGPIWDDSPPPGTFVVIEHQEDFGRIPDVHSLIIIRGHPGRVLALGWMMEHIGEALQQRRDDKSGKVTTAWQSYATKDGIYGARAWGHPHNTGWSTMQLRMDERGTVSYEMRQKTDSDAVTREETCTLRRRAPQPPS